MIPEIFIEEWRSTAPWKTLEMIEQDLIISRALVELYNQDYIKDNLVFRGGTALNKLYLPVPARYSEDIDLVQVKPGPVGDMLDAIREKLDSWLGKPRRKLSESSVKLFYKYEDINGRLGKLKIEINTNEDFQVHNLLNIPYKVNSNWFSGTCKILTYNLNELMATKLRALYQRRKGRDLFDLWYVTTQNLLSIEDMIKIFIKYCKKDNAKITRALFEKNLTDKYAHDDFKLDTHILLTEDVDWSFDEAFQFVDKNIICKLPGLPWKQNEK